MNSKGPHLWLWCCAAVVAPLAIGITTPTRLQAQTPQTVVETTPRAAELEREARFDIPAQSLSTAMIAFAEQSGIQVVTAGEDVEPLQTPGVHGTFTIRDALAELLYGTDLVFVPVGNATIALTTPDAAEAGESLAADDEGATPAAGALYDPNVDVTPEPGGTTSVEVARRAGVEEIIVTGQKREERLQDVPIAISAFSMEDLDAQKIEGGFDLLKAVPNVTFSKTNFSGYNFQIRGIGTQAISATTDPGVAVSFNNTTLIVNRLFEQEYLDIERVEVLRGPQGTLYGRNATAGVINVISAKPVMGEEFGEIKLEAGNFNAQRLRGHYNLPLGDSLALRAAYASTVRDGYGTNLAATDPDREFGDDVRADVDGRDLWTGRLSLGWEPDDRTRINLMWERFGEDDNRVRTSKQLCHRDRGPETLHFDEDIRPGGVDTTFLTEYFRSDISQGCKPGSLYADEAFGTPNGASLPYISASLYTAFYASFNLAYGPTHYSLGYNPNFENPDVPECRSVAQFTPLIDLCNPDPYGGQTQSRSLRDIYSVIEPRYQADADIFELSIDRDLTDGLTLSSQTVYAEDEYFATQDFNRFTTFPVFNDSLTTCGEFNAGAFLGANRLMVPDCTGPDEQLMLELAPGFVVPTGSFDTGVGTYAGGFYRDVSPNGVVCDPQLGCSNSLVVQDLSRASSTQFNQELRLASSFDGDFNFSVGANYTRFETLNDYFVFSNMFTALLNFWPFNFSNPSADPLQWPVGTSISSPQGWCPDKNGVDGAFCRYVDRSPGGIEGIDGDGHNYFRSANPYQLSSAAIFGETYWNITDTLKLTTGARLTWDKKVFTPIPSQLFLADYRELPGVNPGDPPPIAEQCIRDKCPLAGTAIGGRGSPANPDVIQVWREPTGRVVLDWSPDTGIDWWDETMVYGSVARGYKGGGANPPSIAPPAGLVAQRASGGAAVLPTFKAEYVNAFEVGTKNTLFGGAVMLNFSGFYYDYTDYQVSKIIDRTAANENFDATIWGLEWESMFAPTPDTLFNLTVGYLRTRIGDGEESIDLMDRTDGGNRFFAADPEAVNDLGRTTDFPDGFDQWMVIKPFGTAPSNCIAPVELVATIFDSFAETGGGDFIHYLCPTGNPAGRTSASQGTQYFAQNDDGDWIRVPTSGDDDFPQRRYDPLIDAPNSGQGFAKDLSGNELPNAPRFTVAVGGQQTLYLPRGWDLTGRVDWYWQDRSFARVYNTEYDRLKSWTNTNFSLWVNKPEWGLKIEAYVKNAFDETPITGTFLNSDDTGLTTNVFTLDPRLVGVSITKRF